jgi:hypothetical protein
MLIFCLKNTKLKTKAAQARDLSHNSISLYLTLNDFKIGNFVGFLALPFVFSLLKMKIHKLRT